MKTRKLALLASSVGVAVGVFANGLASAAEPQSSIQSTAGLLSLPHARVIVKAPRVATLAMAGQSGIRAFVNPETGRIGQSDPTAEDMQALAPKVQTGSAERAKSVTAAPEMRTSADGRITGVRLQDMLDDNDIMPYSVARRDESGRVQHMCVQGEKAALKAMSKAVKEHNHVR